MIDDSTRHEDQHHSVIAQVIDLGPTAYTDEKFCGGVSWCEIGDWVVVPRVAGCRITKGEEMFRVVNEDDIIALVKDPSDWEVRISHTKF